MVSDPTKCAQCGDPLDEGESGLCDPCQIENNNFLEEIPRGELDCPVCGTRTNCEDNTELGDRRCLRCGYQSNYPNCQRCDGPMLRDGADWKCPNCVGEPISSRYDWPGREGAMKRTEEKLARFDKVTEVKFTLNEKKKERPESMKGTNTPAQTAFLKELYENQNPYYIGDFLYRMAMALAVPDNITEGTFTGKGKHFEFACFTFKMTEKGKEALKELREE